MNDVRGSEANMVPVQGVTRSVEEHGAPVVLTERETEVVRAVVLEGGRKRAARALGLSEQTVRWYLSELFDRARSTGRDVGSLTDLLMVVGWLTVPRRARR